MNFKPIFSLFSSFLFHLLQQDFLLFLSWSEFVCVSSLVVGHSSSTSSTRYFQVTCLPLLLFIGLTSWLNTMFSFLAMKVFLGFLCFELDFP